MSSTDAFQSYLGRVPMSVALDAQAACVAEGRGHVFGFEADAVVTLGLRAGDADLTRGAEALRRLGIEVLRVDRGGQATLHNPGQLVIFPAWRLGRLTTRAWVSVLIETTREFAAELGQSLTWREDRPGLYDAAGGKVTALGLRVRRGVSTHGLAINVRNDFGPFGLIRACGQAAPTLARLDTSLPLEQLFRRWTRVFFARVEQT